jgi:hypothetical protein
VPTDQFLGVPKYKKGVPPEQSPFLGVPDRKSGSFSRTPSPISAVELPTHHTTALSETHPLSSDYVYPRLEIFSLVLREKETAAILDKGMFMGCKKAVKMLCILWCVVWWKRKVVELGPPTATMFCCRQLSEITFHNKMVKIACIVQIYYFLVPKSILLAKWHTGKPSPGQVGRCPLASAGPPALKGRLLLCAEDGTCTRGVLNLGRQNLGCLF